jgi:hypothetical protein
LKPVASKKKGSSWMAARNIPPPRTGMFWPVLPRARMPVGGNRDAGSPCSVTSCTPLLSGAPKVARKVTSSTASPVLSTLMSKTTVWSNVAGVSTPGPGDSVMHSTVLAATDGDWKA